MPAIDNKALMSSFSNNLNNVLKSDTFGARTQFNEKFGLAQKLATAEWLHNEAANIYYTAKDPRERANAKLLAKSIHEEMPGVSEQYVLDNYERIIQTATGNKLNATGLFDVFGQKVVEGYKSFWAGINAIAYTIEDSNKSVTESDVQKKNRQDRQNAYLQSITGKVRTDYYNEYDSFVQKAILGLGDTLPSLLNSTPSMLGAFISSATGIPLFYAVGKGVSDVLNYTMEMGSLVQTLRETNATPDQILAASALYAGISTAIEHNFDKIPEELVYKPAGQFLKLYRQQKGLGAKAVSETVKKIYGSTGKAVADRFLKAGVDWLSETGEEVLQQLAEDLTINLLNDYRKEHGEEALPDYITSTPEEIGKDLVETFKTMGTTQTLISTLEAILGLGFDANFGSIKQLTNANRFTTKSEGSYAKLSGEIVGMQSKNKADKNKKFNAISGKQTSIGYFPTTLQEAQNVGSIKQFDTTKDKEGNDVLSPYSAMQVVDIDNFVRKEKADQTSATTAIGMAAITKDANISVAKDGDIIVDSKHIGEVVRNFVASNYANYQGINEITNDGTKAFEVTIGDKTYTFTSDTNKVGDLITNESLVSAMMKDEGRKVMFTNKQFRQALADDLRKQGIETADDDADNFAQWAEKWSPVIDKLIAPILKENAYADENLASQVTYGSASMLGKLMPVAGFTSEWARDHVVIDDKLESGVKQGEKGFEYYTGYSYWTDGTTGKRVENFSELTDKDNAVFHIAISKLLDQTTGIHEIGHMVLSMAEQKFMADQYFKKAFYDALKKDNTIKNADGTETILPEEEWKIGDATHEAFAQSLEKYIDTGVAQDKQQETLFRKILNAVKAFMDAVRDKLTKEQIEYYDRLFGRQSDLTEDTSEENTDSTYSESKMEADEDYDDEAGYNDYEQMESEAERYSEMSGAERFKTSTELNEQYPGWNDNHTDESGKDKTQIAMTRKTYQKIGNFLKQNPNWKDLLILDASSGLGYGTQDLRDMGFNVEDVEPYPSKKRMNNEDGLVAPTYTDYSQLDKKYDVVISNAVLNVIPDDWRDDVLHKMADVVKIDGRMFINVRSDSEIIKQGTEGKTKTTLDSPSEVLVTDYKNGQQIYRSYQKGFTKDELQEYIQNKLGDSFDVEKANKKNAGEMGGTSVVATRVSEEDTYGTFSNENDMFRYKRVYEIETLEQDLKDGRMVSFYELNKYRLETPWVKAEYIASKIIADGSLQWMGNLLKNIIYDYMEGSNFTWDDITDSDWEKISKAFVRNAKDKHAVEFDGADVEKVLRRLFAWELNSNEAQKRRNWINQYTGRNGEHNEKNILKLARKLKDRGEFDDKYDYSDGTRASKKFRFLDMVVQTAYGKDKNKNYRTTRVGDAYWEGAKKEIEKYADELRAIDQTVGLTSGAKNIEGNTIEDSEINIDYTNITERDVLKARNEAKEQRAKAKELSDQLNKASQEVNDLKAQRNNRLSVLQDTAKELGIEFDEYTTIDELVNSIKEKGADIAETNDMVNMYNDYINAQYNEQIAQKESEIENLKEDLRVEQADNYKLEVTNRRSERKINSLIDRLSKTSDELKNARADLSDYKRKNTTLQNRVEKLVSKLDELKEKSNSEIKLKNTELKQVWKWLFKSDEQNVKLTKQAEEDLQKLNETLVELERVVRIKEKVQRELWRRNEDVKRLQERRLIENSRRKWRKKLEQKSGDATADKALASFARAFFSRPVNGQFNKVEFSSEAVASFRNIEAFLEKIGFMKNNVLLKGFTDLETKNFKEMYEAIKADRDVSNSLSEERIEARKEIVNTRAQQIIDGFGGLNLSKKELQEAHTRFLNDEFETEKQAQIAVFAEKMKYAHEGTREQKKNKRRLGFNERKGLNLNNNIAFNSFTSLWNMLGSVSKDLQNLFYFGDKDLAGINKVTDEYIKARDKRHQFVLGKATELFGEKGAREFFKDANKTVETRQINVLDECGDIIEGIVPDWLAMKPIWRQYALDSTYDESYIDNNLTLSEVIGIYEHAKQNEDLAHILNSRSNIKAMQVAWIVNEFEKEDGVFHKYKDIADAYQSGYEMSWEPFKKVANDVYDIALTRYDYYSPARTSDKDTDIALTFDFDINGLPAKFGRKLTMEERADMQMKTGGNNPISLDYIGDYNRIVDSQEWFINGAEFFKVWNDIMKNNGGGIRQQIDDNFGSKVSDSIIKNMRAVANSVFEDTASGFNQIYNTIRNNMALANLGFSLSSALQQPAVLAFSTAKFGAKNIYRAIGSISQYGGLKGFIQHVYDEAPQIKAFKDVNIMSAEGAIKDGKLFKALKIGQDIARFGMKGIKALDTFSRCITWEAGYQYYIAQDMNSEEAKLRATQDTFNINTSTQAKDNALLYNSKNPLWKSLLIFTNQLNKYWNILIGEDGFGAIKEKKVKQFMATICAFGVSSTMVLLAKGKLLHNNDKDEEWWQDLWKDYIAQGVSIVPVVGDKLSKLINGYSYLDSDIVTSTYNVVKNIIAEDTNGKKQQKIGTAMKNMFTDVFELSGTPKLLYKNTYRSLFDDGRFVGDEFFTGNRWVGLLAPTEWFELITGEEV